MFLSCSWSAEQGKWNFPCPLSRLTVCPRELGSVVRSHVSLLILHTQAESGVYLRDSVPPSHLPLRFPLEPSCAIGLVLSFIRSRDCVNDGIHYRESSGTGRVVSNVAEQTGASYSGNSMDQLMCVPLFPHPLLVEWVYASRRQ